MKTYQEMSKEELTQELTALKAEYEKIPPGRTGKAVGGCRPCGDQL